MMKLCTIRFCCGVRSVWHRRVASICTYHLSVFQWALLRLLWSFSFLYLWFRRGFFNFQGTILWRLPSVLEDLFHFTARTQTPPGSGCPRCLWSRSMPPPHRWSCTTRVPFILVMSDGVTSCSDYSSSLTQFIRVYLSSYPRSRRGCRSSVGLFHHRRAL